MSWLTQNWIWVALAIGVGFYLFRGGLRGHAGGHGGQPESRALSAPADAPQEYASKAAGRPVRPAEAANERPRRRGGC
jgi:hypothetical protein